MEQRIALSQGSNVERYIIDDVIGFGASCLVYKAHFLDNANHQKEVILKECYPYYAGTTRIGNKIVWSNAEERDAAFLRFRQAYDVASEIQNTANAKSVSAYSLEILPDNGTQYVITIPDGDSYDKTKSDDIADIVRTALALTNAVGLYHKAGYDELEPHEKKKYINAAKELAQRLKEIYDQGNFTKVFVDDPLLDYYLDYPKMEVALNTATAIMYDKIGDYDKTYTYAELVIRYSKYCLDKMREEDRKDFPNKKNFEKFFILLINALYENGEIKMLVTLLYDYIRLLRDTLNITDEADKRLLGYYQSLVSATKLSKDMCENPDNYITIGINKTGNNPHSIFTTTQDYDDLIEKYTKLIEQISGQKYHPEIE